MNELTKYEAALPFYNKARTALAKANSVDEVLNIKDRAEQVRVYGVMAKDDEMVSNAVDIKLRCQRRAVAMLDQSPNVGKNGGDRKSKNQCHNVVTLKDVGLTRQEVHNWRPVASVPERVLEKAITAVKKRDGVLTEAAVKRELPKPPSFPHDKKQLPDISEFALKVCKRIDLVLVDDKELSALVKNASAIHPHAKHSLCTTLRKLITRLETLEAKFQ